MLRRGESTVRARRILVAELLVDVSQRARDGNSLWYREAQSVGLSRTVVWVLTYDDYLDVFESRCEVGPGMDQVLGREDVVFALALCFGS